MRKTGLLFLCHLVLLCLLACSAEPEYSSWYCRFSYNNQIHNDVTLATALDGASRGVFCLITESTRAGVKYLNFQNSDGLTSQKPESAEESQARFVLGLNNGIIVGFQTLNTDGMNGGFVGYDVQCPNCVRRENNTISPNYRVVMAHTMSGEDLRKAEEDGFDLKNMTPDETVTIRGTDLNQAETAQLKALLISAVFYALGYLYEHREQADHHDLVMTLRNLLSSVREGVF